MDKYLKVTLVILLALTVGVAIFPSSALSDGDTVTEKLLEDTFTIGVEGDALRSLNTASKVIGPKDKLAVRYFDDDKKCLAESYSITLNNGGSQKNERVTSAVVILNDRILYKQSDFNKEFTGNSTTLPASLIKEKDNVLEVKVNGKPGANIKIGVYGAYKQSQDPAFVTWYLDFDGDGYGKDHPAPFTPQVLPIGVEPDAVVGYDNWVEQGGDCLDETGTDAYTEYSRSIKPGVEECPPWIPPVATGCP
jgi:hypothetical protein